MPEMMEDRRFEHTAAVCGGIICAVGGTHSPDAVEMYDTASHEWNELPGGGMPHARKFSASAVYKGKLYVVGGENIEEETLRSVAVFDLATQHWSLLPTEMATPRSAHGAVVCGDKLYVVGGDDEEDAYLDSVEVYVRVALFFVDAGLARRMMEEHACNTSTSTMPLSLLLGLLPASASGWVPS
jgi:hypothetical protein